MSAIRRSLVRKLSVTKTAFRRYTHWLTPQKKGSYGHFWPRKLHKEKGGHND